MMIIMLSVRNKNYTTQRITLVYTPQKFFPFLYNFLQLLHFLPLSHCIVYRMLLLVYNNNYCTNLLFLSIYTMQTFYFKVLEIIKIVII